MNVDECPLPEVAEALNPYIRPRDEVQTIRRGLQGYLQTQLQLDGTQLSPINLSDPPVSDIDDAPAGLSGVRKAYWKALQAHTAAQAKYDALKTELEQLKLEKSGPANNVGKASSDIINDNYLPLLRQREKQRKLKVVENALSDMTSAGGAASANGLDDMIKKKLGEMPTPPSTQPSSTKSPEVEAKITDLKRAIISKKQQVDARKNKVQQSSVRANGGLSPQADIAGLQKALQELTTWMESQLTMIATAEAESQSVTESPVRGKSDDGRLLSTEDIEALYEEYLEARQRLIQTVNDSSTDSTGTMNVDDFILPRRRTRSAESGKGVTISPAEAILPYIPTLIALKEEEQSTLQHSTYVRKQLTTAEAETDRLIRRLADESHLVQPGASSCKDWAAASKEAGKETEKFVKERMEAGGVSVKSAQHTLDSIGALPGSLDQLIEKA